MKRQLILAISALLLSTLALPAQNARPSSKKDAYQTFGQHYNPKAEKKAVVTVKKKVRFTVLSDRLIRMEWSDAGKFIDGATLTVVNRAMPVPQFKKQAGRKVTITTDAITLTYTGKGARFDADNLKVTFTLNGEKVTWSPSSWDSGNLKGTVSSIDGVSGRMGKNSLAQREAGSSEIKEIPMGNGILSRDGWAILDDSDNCILLKDESKWGEWVAARPFGDRQDLYIFAYGHDYTAALSDYAAITGSAPLPPKFAFGYWWGRQLPYTDDDILETLSEMRGRGIPVDAVMMDRDWHETWKGLDARYGKDEFGQDHGNTGYTWNRDLIPDPDGFISDVHRLGVKLALNVRPASGVHVYEEPYTRFVSNYTARTADIDAPANFLNPNGHHATVPFRMSQQAWADTYFNTVIHPLEKNGVDFWWVEWQQWETSRYISGLNPAFWCGFTFWKDMDCRYRESGPGTLRPITYQRWGGLGSHRYQLGYSGNIYAGWPALAMMPYFTATASNVMFGYLGNDIGGTIILNDDPADPELFTRWMQFGVFTPIFKTYSCDGQALERKLWAYPSHLKYLKAAVELRYDLIPYIYSAAREAYDTGVSICRPMYYSNPEDTKAYSYDEQYFFGPDIIATALCQPASLSTGLTERKVWLPAGNDWYDMAHHRMMPAGTEQTLYYSIAENPWFVRESAVIPMSPSGISSTAGLDGDYRLLVIPGKTETSCTLYEDDGATMSYDTRFAKTTISRTPIAHGCRIRISPAEGSFNGQKTERKFTLVFEDYTDVSTVLVNGLSVGFETQATSTVVSIGTHPISEELVIEVVRKK
ncbi:MAG: DUF5110 domain-containing protein [Bacteroidales bacterium]|nr:DUF5110 domain-containing protein [Bacteroidales bacterium]